MIPFGKTLWRINLLSLFYCLLLLITLTHLVRSDGCPVTLTIDVPNISPVYFYSKSGSSPTYELLKPEGDTTTLPYGSKLLLICTGSSSNVISSLNIQSLELTCSSGNIFKGNDGTTHILKQLECSSIPSSTLRLSSQSCANNKGYIFESGFDYGTNKFVPLLTICYDNTNEHTYYTYSILNGRAINYRIQAKSRRPFDASGMKLTATAASNLYSFDNQKSRFQQFFGTSENYITSTSYLELGHMAPETDMIFPYEQFATYYYIDAAPQFHVVNYGNWMRVENMVRTLAATYDDDFEIYNGVLEELQLPDPSVSTKKITINLDPNSEFKAPKYYFKVIKHEATDSAIVMISMNNPFATSEDIDEFCTNVCEDAGLSDPYYSDLSKGYTFCCRLVDFKRYYGDLPSTLEASNLLNKNPLLNSVSDESDGCSVTLSKDVQKFAPVYLYSKSGSSSFFELLKPTGDTTSLRVGSKLLLVCTGSSSNVITSLKIKSLELTCSFGNIFKGNEGNTYILKKLECLSTPSSTLRLTSQFCSKGRGYIFESGFEYGINNFVPLFTICYDNTTEHIYYTYNILNGRAINYRIWDSTSRSYSVEGMKMTPSGANTLYTIFDQISRFELLFGPNDVYISSTSYLQKALMTPEADMIFGYEQLATCYYANVAPQFHAVNVGNWLRVEMLARSLAAGLHDDLEIYNGVLDNLKLPDPSVPNKKVEVTLDPNNKMNAPNYFYKVIFHKGSNSAIVMITMNNPFATLKDVDTFCENVCAEAGVLDPYYSEYSRGYTFCCRLKTFLTHCKDLPTDLYADNLLRNVQSISTNDIDTTPRPVVVTTAAPLHESDGCPVTLTRDISNFSPVYFYSETSTSPIYRLWKPVADTSILPLKSKLLLICTGSSSNVITSLNIQSLELTCSSGNVFKGNDKNTYHLKKLQCSSIPSSKLRFDATTCANSKGFIFESGFDYGPSKFAPLFTICYDKSAERTYYTHNVINGRAIDYRIEQKSQKPFDASERKLSETAINTLYSFNNQIFRFETFFGPNDIYITSTSYLEQGHMTPDTDMIFPYEYFATYYCMNAAPQFHVVNAGNWMRVENMVLALAITYNDDLEIYNGVLDYLQLPDPSHTTRKVAITLDANNEIKVPKYFFKVINHKATDSAIVMITMNNPFATSEDIAEFCKNVCGDADLSDFHFSDLSKGYTFCCRLSDFQLYYKDLPTDLKASKLLQKNPSGSSKVDVIATKSPVVDHTTVDPRKSCAIDLFTDITKNCPVYLYSKTGKSKYDLFKPQGKITYIPIGSKLLLTCPLNLVLTNLKIRSIELTCSSQNVFKDDSGKIYTLKNLPCSSIPYSSLILTSNPCANKNGYFFESGFTYNEHIFASLFSICYNNQTEQTYYTYNIINGEAINHSFQDLIQKPFIPTGMKLMSTAIEALYNNKKQIAKFKKLFGDKQHYVTTKSFMVPGQLTPDKDMIFPFDQAATYYYTNAAPLFKAVDKGNWYRVELLARSYAANFNDDLEIYNGHYEDLYLPHSSQKTKKVPVTLDQHNKIKAPKYFFKVIRHKDADAAVVMIVLNNPFATAGDIQEFCINICQRANLINVNFDDLSQGYTFCCLLSDFKKLYKFLPTSLSASRLLVHP